MTRRNRLRRRLYLISAPVLLIALVASLKMISVVVAGDAARSDFVRHDLDALEFDVSVLQILDVVEPGRTAWAAGDLDVLAGRLPEAERRFVDALARTGHDASCPVRINLLLVRETLGDLAVRESNSPDAQRRYREALAVAREAPQDCFAGNDDPDADRRAIRADAIARLEGKLEVLAGPALPPPAVPPPPVGLPPPPPPPAPSAPEEVENSEAPERRLGTGGDPAERLRILLDNANSAGTTRE